MSPTERRRSRIWRVLRVLLAVGIILAVFVAVIPQIADYQDVWDIIGGLSGAQLLLVTGVAVANLATYWVQSMAAMPGLTLPMAAVQTQTTTTIANTVPGGGAAAVGMTFAMFRSWGYSDGDAARFTLVTGIWNTYIKLGLPVIALALVAVEGRANQQLAIASAIGVGVLLVSIVLLALVLWKESFARRIGSGLQRPVRWAEERLHRTDRKDWGRAAVGFRRDTIELLRTRWLWLTITTIVSHITLFLVLLVALRVVGVPQDQVTWIDAFAAFSFARLVTALPVTPGGVGVIELSYIGTLVWAGGAHADVVAAVLLFRALTYFLQIPLGAITYPIWQRTKDRWHRTDGRQRTPARRRQPSRAAG
jgi:putative heme transporter